MSQCFHYINLSALIDVLQKSLLVNAGTTKRYIVYISGFEILGSLHKRFKNTQLQNYMPVIIFHIRSDLGCYKNIKQM